MTPVMNNNPIVLMSQIFLSSIKLKSSLQLVKKSGAIEK